MRLLLDMGIAPSAAVVSGSEAFRRLDEARGG
jgi:hypothetical protein